MTAQIAHYRMAIPLPPRQVHGATILIRPPAITEQGRIASGGTAGRPRALVIGDRESDRTLVCSALTALAVQVDYVADEKAAWDLIVAHPYDLHVILLPLAQADGLAMCRRLRTVDARRPIMVLATARASSESDAALAAFEAGADAYLSAPISADELRV